MSSKSNIIKIIPILKKWILILGVSHKIISNPHSKPNKNLLTFLFFNKIKFTKNPPITIIVLKIKTLILTLKIRV